MPSSHVKTAMAQLEKKFKEGLRDANVAFEKIDTYATCRRLVVTGFFSPKQKDREVEVIGPPQSVALTQDGSPSQAAVGFAKAQGVTVSHLQIFKTNKGEYIGVKKIERGKPTQEILRKLVPQIIFSLTFPKTMGWGENIFRFSRPITNLFCLFDGKAMSFHTESLSSRNYTTGHKIYFPQKIKVNSFHEYKESLRKNKVVI